MQYQVHILFSLAVCTGALKTNETSHVPAAVWCWWERGPPPKTTGGGRPTALCPGAELRFWMRSPDPGPPADIKKPGRFRGNASNAITNLENTSCLGEKAARRKAQLASISSAFLASAPRQHKPERGVRDRACRCQRVCVFLYWRSLFCSFYNKMDQQPYVASRFGCELSQTTIICIGSWYASPPCLIYKYTARVLRTR